MVVSKLLQSKKDSDSKFELDEKITLEILSTVDMDSKVTQRSMASKLGIALGLTNAYLKRAAEKGFVKIQQIPRNRYAYYLTPNGFSEKARLTAEYFKASYNFFRKSRQDCEIILKQCLLLNKCVVVLSDVSELAEIFILSALDSKVHIVGIYGNKKSTYSGVKVFNKFKNIPKFDLVILTAIKNSQQRYHELLKTFDEDKILIPNTLNIRKNK